MTTRVSRVVLELATNAQEFLGNVKATADAAGSRLKASFDSAGKSLQTFGKDTKALGIGLTTAVTGPILGVVGGLSALTLATVKSGDEIAKNARTSGLSAQAYQELTFALGQVAKVTDEELVKGFSKFTVAIGDAAAGTKAQQDALLALGFTQEEVASGAITTEAAMDRLIVGMQGAASEADAMALAGDLVGDRLGPKLAGALRASGDQVDGLRQQFTDLGLGMSDEALAASEKFNDQMDVVTRQLGAVGRQLGEAVLPLLTDVLVPAMQRHVIPAFQKLAEWVKVGIEWFKNLSGPVQVAIGAAVALAAALGPILIVVGSIASAIGAALPVIGTIGGAFLALATGPVGVVIAAITGLIAVWHFFGDEISGVLSGVWTFISDTFTSIMGIFDVFPDALLPLLGPIGAIVLAFRHWEQIVTIAKGVYEGVKGWIVDKMQPILDWVKGVWSSIFGEKAAIFQQDIQLTDDKAASDDRAAVAATGLGDAATFSIRGVRAQADATKDATKAADDATKAFEAQVEALQALGVLTRDQVTDEIQKLQGALSAAAREGEGPTQKAVGIIIVKLVELRRRALEAGQSVELIDRELAALRQTARDMAGPFPTLTAQLTTVLPQMEMVTGEMLAQQTEAYLLGRAYTTLGLETQASLDKAAEAARIAYADILASGQATERQLIEARGRVEQAEVEAGQRTVSLWQTQIQPAIEGAWQNITGSLATNFTDMLTGATGFKDGFTSIWEDLKGSVRGILDTLLQTFLNEFLGGMLEGMSGWARQAGSIISSVFGMGKSGMSSLPTFGGTFIPSLAAPGAGAGGAAAGGGLAAGLATTGLGIAAGASAYTIGKMGWEWGKSFFGDHYDETIENADDPSMHANQQAIGAGVWDSDLDNVGAPMAEGGIISARRGGTLIRAGEAGADEAIVPLPPGFDLVKSLEAASRNYDLEKLERRFSAAIFEIRQVLPLAIRDAVAGALA